MKKILFPTDFSAPANNAFVYALQLADKLNASITTLHAFSHPEIHIERGGIHPEALEHVYESIDMDEFENYRDSIPALRDIAEKENLTQVEMYHVMEDGPVIPKILQTIKEGDYDLVVMGTVCRTGLPGLLIGNTAETILSTVPCSVMTVKPSGFASPIEVP